VLSTQEAYESLLSLAVPRLNYETAAKGKLAQWQKRLYREAALLLRVPAPTPGTGDPEVLETEHLDGYTRTRLSIRAPDGAAIPVYLLVPDGLDTPVPAVLALHGHGPGKVVPAGVLLSQEVEKLIAEGERDYAVQAVRQRYVALAPDLRGFGEMRLKQDVKENRGNSCTSLACRLAQLGQTLLGLRVADLGACVDYLLSRPDVDKQRIWCMGQSGGGTATLFTAAMDERIAGAIISCYFCTFAASIMSIYHCPCNYVPGLQLVAEMYDLAGLIAPRPLLVIAGREDGIFPIDGVYEAYYRLERVYRDAGAERNLELYVGEGGHRFYSERAWPFLREHL